MIWLERISRQMLILMAALAVIAFGHCLISP